MAALCTHALARALALLALALPLALALVYEAFLQRHNQINYPALRSKRIYFTCEVNWLYADNG